MSNMSYCRFQNTAKDLRDCIENWYGDEDQKADPYINQKTGDESPLSPEEFRARSEILEMAEEIIEKFGEDSMSSGFFNNKF